MSKLILGLDLGITSIGWALVKTDNKEVQNNEIVASGVRIFTRAEHPKTGESLALPRRTARGARRNLKRKAQKLRAIKRLLIKNNILTSEELEHLFIGNKGQKDVWQLRHDALYRVLDNKEFARILIHIAKHRGYQSNRKSEAPSDKDGKAVLLGIEENSKLLATKSYKTIGEYIATKEKKRNGKRDGKLYYENSVSREMLVDEIELIFKIQNEFGALTLEDELLREYKKIAFTQRALKSVEHMVANCPFEPNEKRAPKSAITFLKFRAIQTLKHLRYIDSLGEHTLSIQQIEQVLEEAKSVKTPRTYAHLRKFFKLNDDVEFKGVTYFDAKTGEAVKSPEKDKLVDFTPFHKIKTVIQNVDNLFWDSIDEDDTLLDNIAYILTVEKNDDITLKRLLELKLPHSVSDALLTLSFNGVGHISTKALQKINKEFSSAESYDKACENAGYDFKAIFKGEKTLLLPPLSKQENVEMTNPVVKRAISQMRKVYNAIARKYGAIDALHIEFTRDIKKSYKDRMKIQKEQKAFQDTKEEARVYATEILGHEPNAKELLKFRLWKEQSGFCVYSNEEIKPYHLLNDLDTQVDHILPYSRSLDDSLNNKVLCFTKENQEKSSKTPFEWMDEKRFYEFSVRVKNLTLKKAKKERLLKQNFDESSEGAFKDRNKNDTSYISRFIKNYVEAHIAFKESHAKRHVFTMNGMLTTQLRYKWGVGDKNRDTHLHHAEDALILAFSTQSMVQKLSTISAKRENSSFIYKSKEEKSKALHFVTPMEDFGKKVRENVEEIFVSHMPRRKVSGAAHEETIYSAKTLSVTKENGKKEFLKGNGVTNNVKLKHGVAKNDSMPRVDLFQHKKSKKYFVVPIYVSDFVKETLPNKAIVAGNKPWLEMDEEYEFKFSFYKSDLIEIKTKQTAKKESVQALGYFTTAVSSTGQILLTSHDGKEEYLYGTQNLIFIKKYQVDLLGNYVEVQEEKRVGTLHENKKLRRV